MTYSTQTRLLLGGLTVVVIALVAYDLWRPPEAAAPQLAQVAPEVPSATRRVLDKTPLLYEGEFLRNLLARLRPALVAARPESPGEDRWSGQPWTSGFLTDDTGLALVALVSRAPRWRVLTGAGDVADGELVGVDAVHGVALLRVTLPSPVPPLPLATGVPLSAVEPLIGMTGSAAGGDVRLLLSAGSAASLESELLEVGMRPGELGLDADGRVRAFAARTERGVQPLYSHEVEEIVAALAHGGRHPHPWLGFELQTVADTLREEFGDGTIAVVHVDPDSPAAKARLTPGMAFVEVRAGDRTAHTAEGVENMLEVGLEVTLEPAKTRRARPPRAAVTVVVEDRQRPLPVGSFEVAAFGLMSAEAPPGVSVVVAPGGAAAERGLRTGDVVEAVDLRAVRSTSQLERALAARGPHLITVRRGIDRFFVRLDAPGAGSTPDSPGPR